MKGTVLTRYEDRFRLIELHRVEWGSKLHDAIRQNCIFNTNNLWGRRIGSVASLVIMMWPGSI